MTSSPLAIEYWALARLVSPSRKLRKNDPAVDRMAASIEEYGFKIPILVSSEGETVDGELRLKAARKLASYLGSAGYRVRRLDPDQVRRFRLLANRSANWAEWDLHAVAEELAELRTLKFEPDWFRCQRNRRTTCTARRRANTRTCPGEASGASQHAR